MRRAFTLIEVLVAIAIVVILVGLLQPVVSQARRQGQINASVQKVRQLWVNLQNYRHDYEGIDYAYRSTFELGLPPYRQKYLFDTPYAMPKGFWESPCGPDEVIHRTGITNVNGWIVATHGFYDSELVEGGSNIRYRDYLGQFMNRSVVYHDPYCNPSRTDFSSPLASKRVISITLDGTLYNRVRIGDGLNIRFYSDPP